MKVSVLTVNNHVVHLRTVGRRHRPAVVLVHGLGVSGEYFLDYARVLSRHYSIYIFDFPGFGTTPKPASPLTIHELSEVLTESIAQLSIKNCILVGQSMGCQIVAKTLEHAPSLATKAILIGPTVNKSERTLFKQGLRLFQDSFYESPKANWLVTKNYLRMGPLRYAKTARHMVKTPIETSLKSTHLPILFVRGSRDPIAPKSWIDYLARISPHGRSAEIAGAAHLAQVTHARELASLTKQFITS